MLTPHDFVIAEELNDSLQIALEKMPERPRQVFQLRRQKGLSTEEIAQQLGLSKSTVENHMNKALSHLRKNLSIPTVIIWIVINSIYS